MMSLGGLIAARGTKELAGTPQTENPGVNRGDKGAGRRHVGGKLGVGGDYVSPRSSQEQEFGTP